MPKVETCDEVQARLNEENETAGKGTKNHQKKRKKTKTKRESDPRTQKGTDLRTQRRERTQGSKRQQRSNHKQAEQGTQHASLQHQHIQLFFVCWVQILVWFVVRLGLWCVCRLCAAMFVVVCVVLLRGLLTTPPSTQTPRSSARHSRLLDSVPARPSLCTSPLQLSHLQTCTTVQSYTRITASLFENGARKRQAISQQREMRGSTNAEGLGAAEATRTDRGECDEQAGGVTGDDAADEYAAAKPPTPSPVFRRQPVGPVTMEAPWWAFFSSAHQSAKQDSARTKRHGGVHATLKARAAHVFGTKHDGKESRKQERLFFHSSVFLVFFKGIARNLSSRSPLVNLLLLLSSLETNLRRVHALIHPAQNLFGKMMSQQKMSVEAVRPTQAATERLFAFENARCLSHDPNPLLEFFKNDRVIAQLELDGQEIKKRLALSYFGSPACFCPCYWPCQVMWCLPISVCCKISAVDAAVKAHHLVLRERSIEYRVEKYPRMDAPPSCMACCACCEDYAGGIHEVYPLSDVSSIGVEPCQAQCCGENQAPDHGPQSRQCTVASLQRQPWTSPRTALSLRTWWWHNSSCWSAACRFRPTCWKHTSNSCRANSVPWEFRGGLSKHRWPQSQLPRSRGKTWQLRSLSSRL